MLNKIFAKSHILLNWLVISSSDPQAVAMTAKGLMSLGAVQAIFGMLPFLGFHPTFDLNSLGDQIYAITYGTLTAVSGIMLVVGGLRKVWNYFFGYQPTP